MNKVAIKIGQIWRSKMAHHYQVLITGKRNDKWNAKVLTEKTDVYRATHKLASNTIWSKFELIK